MAWIKRNLFFVIGAIIALGLLAAAGVYDYQNWRRNNTALDALNQTYATLHHLNNAKYLPGNDKINNIQAARKQARQLHEWIQHARVYFQPIPPIPNPANGVITDARFAAARDHTLNQLQVEAGDASVTLPAQYGFSFDAERSLVKFAPGSLAPLAYQLGQVKTICEILYAAKINALDGIRRVRVSQDDMSGPQADYLDETATTNDLAILTPYEVTFRGFSGDLAHVLASFAVSSHDLIVTGINVQPASSATTPASSFAGPGAEGEFGQPAPAPNPYALRNPYARRNPYLRNPYYGLRNPYATQAAPAPSPTVLGVGGLPVVLNEQLLSITLEIKVVKLLPGK